MVKLTLRQKDLTPLVLLLINTIILKWFAVSTKVTSIMTEEDGHAAERPLLMMKVALKVVTEMLFGRLMRLK